MGGSKRVRAIGLLSGGLDSTLAARILLEQNIEVIALHIRLGFSYEERAFAGLRPPGVSNVERAARMLGVPLEIIDAAADFLPLVLRPRYGYGSGMNPCVDCRILLLRQAKGWMEAHGGDFVFTGEVVGQRPKSQMRPTLRTVERESGLQGYLLRPLSAKLLEPTIPEQRGWVDREKLYGISGRGRREQIALAQKFGLTDLPQPFGGCCYLIDQTYARRLRDLLAHEGENGLTGEQVQLLAAGRHLRLPSGHKVIVGRNACENDYLETVAVAGVLLTTVDYPGPTTLVMGEPDEEAIALAARITAGYSDGRNEPIVRVSARKGGEVKMLAIAPLALEESRRMMV